MLLNCFQQEFIEAGCDEAGRGCLAGPVYAAAVILPPDFTCETLTDSKQLSAQQREKLRVVIERDAVSWAVGWVDNEEIDQINILNASYLAMHRALDQLSVKPGFLVIDGNRFKAYPHIQHSCIVKGDGKFLNIAAASILAKTHRDEYMRSIGEDYPAYAWHQNKGYATRLHREVTLRLGFTPYHRKTFHVAAPQLELFDGC